jgi:hypothetical protein
MLLKRYKVLRKGSIWRETIKAVSSLQETKILSWKIGSKTISQAETHRILTGLPL